MLHLSIDVNEGVSIIPCPRCGRPLLLGYAKMGRLLVLYDGGVRRSRGPALLVCPELTCSHQEPVELVRDSLDAVAFNPFGAYWHFQAQQDSYHRSIAEMDRMMKQYAEQYSETHNPKLPSLIRFWRKRFEYTCSSVTHTVHEAQRKREAVHLVGPNLDETGYVKSIRSDGVVLRRTKTDEEIFCEAGELHSAWMTNPKLALSLKEEDDGPGSRHWYGDIQTINEGHCFAVVDGHTFQIEHALYYGMVRLHTKDAALAKAYGFIESVNDLWVGEWPAALIQRAYRRIRLCYVHGFRLRIASATTDPDVFQVATSRLHIAEALGMKRPKLIFCTRRGLSRDRFRFFHRREIDRIEELQVPYKLYLPRDRVRRKR